MTKQVKGSKCKKAFEQSEHRGTMRREIKQRMGEDLDDLTIEELRDLEQNMDKSLKVVRDQKDKRDDDPDWSSSHKYEVMRGLAEKLINENLREGSETLREVNHAALFGVFSKTLCQLEATMSRQQEHRPIINGDGEVGSKQLRRRRNRVLGAIRPF
ncbi:uncharacterized protein LOC122094366 isoform X2 [Macadamia integrifolia]|uniref:uncharacterized protein LOC122094366 isoform X2 n=1 Tax=Macadamia integrifolia TaxID=60698 RepID=UPI001C527F6F|nr:uncharacterized protein LOC122094366 isoform X2 [Macadamia integrifolia]